MEILLDSNPNYNYLYSNFSKKTTESNLLEAMLINRFDEPQYIIDLLYGSDLDVNKNSKKHEIFLNSSFCFV